FYQLTIANITAANIGPGGICGADGCDTILLNVASSGMACNVSTALSSTEESVLLNFLDSGGKLIIYDSECPPQDYSWLPYPFTTANPGALGASGTLTIVENNVLSSDNTADASYIDANVLASQTDAIGDMNVMTTQDANWCLDMSGTNAISVTGPVQTYARYGSGLLIYNGMDVDVMAAGTTPETASGYGNLAKVWLQDLQAPFNPTPVSDLPCGATVVGIVLGPATASYDLAVGPTQHTVTATLKDLLNNPQAGIPVTFSVLTGPNAGVAGVCDTGSTCASNINGEVNFTYTSNGKIGTDEIQACYMDSSEQTQCSQVVTVEWTRSTTPPPTPGQDVALSGSGAAGPLELLSLLAGLSWFGLRRRRK
ncbi:MAG: Ig-like domain-containing protein, partial [Gammaproteobacteria bacterium]|nr:Ig-like domain-containing protein [Gammaproteobacteria bacterium]